MNQVPKPRVLLLHCERFAPLERLNEDGYFHLILVVNNKGFKEEIDGQVGDEVYAIDYRETDAVKALARKLHQQAPLAAVLSLRDESAFVAFELCRELGIAGVEEEAARTVDSKARLRKLLNDNGLSPTRFQVLQEAVDDVSPIVEKVGLPLICKPHNASGSFLVEKCETPQALRRYLDDYSFESPLLIEEFLRGPEYSVESFTRDGCHQVVAITEKFTTGPPYFVELGHIIPAAVSPGDAEQIRDLALAMLDLVGVRSACSHTEVKLTPRGPRIIESHFRPGGDGIEQLVAAAYDFVMTSEALKALTGLPMKPPLQTPRAFVTSQFLNFTPGRITRLQGVDSMAHKQGVKVFSFPFKCGDELPVIRNSYTRHGFFGCVTSSRSDLDRLIREIRGGCIVEVEPQEISA